jgi:hypothetical protein
VIYPTLTLLEELGSVTVTPKDGGRKPHTITSAGEAFLSAHRKALDMLTARKTIPMLGRLSGNVVFLALPNGSAYGPEPAIPDQEGVSHAAPPMPSDTRPDAGVAARVGRGAN